MEALQQKHVLDEETQSKVRFITFIITMFARAYKMNKQNAYLYLEKYNGLDYLFKHWWTLHTESEFWAVRDIFEFCRQNGGLK